MSGTLYLIATPIGNLEDITLRAVKTLKEVDLIVAEDTRQTLKLLNHLNISKALISYHRHSDEKKLNHIMNNLIEGKNIAIVSDAGTPCISDPGEDIVKQAIQENVKIVTIPGACALISGLVASGINTDEFTFMGFLPQNKKTRKEKIDEIQKATKTIILYESPYEINQLIEDLMFLDDRQIVLAREITKIHEEYIRGTVAQIKQMIKEPRGEYVVIIEGSKTIQENPLLKLTIEEHYKYYEKQDMEKKDIIKKIAKDRKVAKNEIYKIFNK